MTGKMTSARDRFLMNALASAREAYASGAIDAEAMKAQAIRISGLRALSKKLDHQKSTRAKFLERSARHLGMIRDAVDPVLVAIDVGFDKQTSIVEEVGVTVLRAGAFTTTNFIVEGYEERRSGIPCHLGETVVLPLKQIVERVQDAYDNADFCVFHSAANDVKLLGLDTSKTRYFDTSYLALRWYRSNSPKLVELCKRYGIDVAGAHNSGNDSRLTLQALHAMVHDSSSPYPGFKTAGAPGAVSDF